MAIIVAPNAWSGRAGRGVLVASQATAASRTSELVPAVASLELVFRTRDILLGKGTVGAATHAPSAAASASRRGVMRASGVPSAPDAPL